MTRALRQVADKTAGGRIAMVLEGGYDLSALEAGLLASMRGMIGNAAFDTVPRNVDDGDVARAGAATHQVWSNVR